MHEMETQFRPAFLFLCSQKFNVYAQRTEFCWINDKRELRVDEWVSYDCVFRVCEYDKYIKVTFI